MLLLVRTKAAEGRRSPSSFSVSSSCCCCVCSCGGEPAPSPVCRSAAGGEADGPSPPPSGLVTSPPSRRGDPEGALVAALAPVLARALPSPEPECEPRTMDCLGGRPPTAMYASPARDARGQFQGKTPHTLACHNRETGQLPMKVRRKGERKEEEILCGSGMREQRTNDFGAVHIQLTGDGVEHVEDVAHHGDHGLWGRLGRVARKVDHVQGQNGGEGVELRYAVLLGHLCVCGWVPVSVWGPPVGEMKAGKKKKKAGTGRRSHLPRQRGAARWTERCPAAGTPGTGAPLPAPPFGC